MRSDILAAIDPRAKLVAFLAVQALLFIPSPQPLRLRLTVLAIILLFLLPLAGRAWRRWLRLLAVSAPLLAFLGFSAFLQSGSPRPAPQWIVLAITAKAMLVLLSLALFILGEEPGRLLQALRQSGTAPVSRRHPGRRFALRRPVAVRTGGDAPRLDGAQPRLPVAAAPGPAPGPDAAPVL